MRIREVAGPLRRVVEVDAHVVFAPSDGCD